MLQTPLTRPLPTVLRKAFAMFDEEKTGFIETTQLGGILKDLGQVVDPEELNNTIKDMDVEGKRLMDVFLVPESCCYRL